MYISSTLHYRISVYFLMYKLTSNYVSSEFLEFDNLNQHALIYCQWSLIEVNETGIISHTQNHN